MFSSLPHCSNRLFGQGLAVSYLYLVLLFDRQNIIHISIHSLKFTVTLLTDWSSKNIQKIWFVYIDPTLFMKLPCVPSKLLPHCSQIYDKQIISSSFMYTTTLLKEAIWTDIMNVLCIPSNLLSHNVVYELTMHRFNTCFLKTSATLLTD